MRTQNTDIHKRLTFTNETINICELAITQVKQVKQMALQDKCIFSGIFALQRFILRHPETNICYHICVLRLFCNFY